MTKQISKLFNFSNVTNNPKTSIAAVIVAILVLLVQLEIIAPSMGNSIIAAISALGLSQARDGDKSSEDQTI
jgi:hypothetical protein